MSFAIITDIVCIKRKHICLLKFKYRTTKLNCDLITIYQTNNTRKFYLSAWRNTQNSTSRNFFYKPVLSTAYFLNRWRWHWCNRILPIFIQMVGTQVWGKGSMWQRSAPRLARAYRRFYRWHIRQVPLNRHKVLCSHTSSYILHW